MRVAWSSPASVCGAMTPTRVRVPSAVTSICSSMICPFRRFGVVVSTVPHHGAGVHPSPAISFASQADARGSLEQHRFRGARLRVPPAHCGSSAVCLLPPPWRQRQEYGHRLARSARAAPHGLVWMPSCRSPRFVRRCSYHRTIQRQKSTIPPPPAVAGTGTGLHLGRTSPRLRVTPISAACVASGPRKGGSVRPPRTPR